MPVVVLVVLFWTSAFYVFIPEENTPPVGENKFTETETVAETSAEEKTLAVKNNSESIKYTSGSGNLQEQITSYALSLLGTPYIYAGMSPSGFDCSGFITYVYDRHGIKLPHSSAMQANEGIQVAKHEARTGDLVIFTGTNPNVREPGHVGIVLSSPGDTIEFVHSSSNGGVKISQVEGTRYDVRYLQIRRVL